MLNINIEDNAKITDIETLFKTIKIQGTPEERVVINKIEQAEYNDTTSFIDRFGFKLHMSELSTGCKAALCILNMPDITINTIECGINAIDVIISICKNGNIIMRDRGVTIQDYSDDGIINVAMDKYKFTTIERLNYYIFNERPFEPDMYIGGIENV